MSLRTFTQISEEAKGRIVEVSSEEVEPLVTSGVAERAMTVALWEDIAPLIKKGGGRLVLDDTTLDKPHARKMSLGTPHWSDKYKRVVLGINPFTHL